MAILSWPQGVYTLILTEPAAVHKVSWGWIHYDHQLVYPISGSFYQDGGHLLHTVTEINENLNTSKVIPI